MIFTARRIYNAYSWRGVLYGLVSVCASQPGIVEMTCTETTPDLMPWFHVQLLHAIILASDGRRVLK